MKRTKALLLLAVVGLTTNAVRADQIDQTVLDFLLFSGTPGLSLAVVKDGQPIKMRGYGLANIETNTPATSKTVYRIASVSKQFIASAIMLLAQEGKLATHDRVTKYFPDAPATWSEITVARLLSHTSGLVRECPAYNGYDHTPLKDIIKSAYPLKLASPTGTAYLYSNVGYFILAEIISQVSGMPYGKFISQRIFQPTGMSTSGLTDEFILIPNRAKGFEWENGTLVGSENYQNPRPSGAFLSTVEDMVKWDAALYQNNILSEASKTEMWTPIKFNDGKPYNYGYGWALTNIKGHQIVQHNGSNPGYRSSFAHYPNDRLCIVVLTNNGDAVPESLGAKIGQIVLPDTAPEPFKAITDPDPAKTKTLVDFFSALAQGKIKIELVEESLSGSATFKAIATRAKSWGGLTQVTPLEARGATNSRYRLTFQKLRLNVLTKIEDGKIVTAVLSQE